MKRVRLAAIHRNRSRKKKKDPDKILRNSRPTKQELLECPER